MFVEAPLNFGWLLHSKIQNSGNKSRAQWWRSCPNDSLHSTRRELGFILPKGERASTSHSDSSQMSFTNKRELSESGFLYPF
jgi:hypothetical protein